MEEYILKVIEKDIKQIEWDEHGYPACNDSKHKAKEITGHVKEWVQWYFSKGQFDFRFSNLEESYQYWNENINGK